MDFDTIFKDGMDEVLCIMRDLPSYPPAKLKQEEYKIARYEIEDILFRFQEYIKGLPDPGVPLSSKNRILIYNARNILEGLSIVFNVQIGYIKRLYSNYLKYKEKQLIPDPYNRADLMKPKKKTAKTRKPLHMPNVIETPDAEVPITRDAVADLSFFDMAAPAVPPSVPDGAALFERDSQLLSSLGEAAELPEDMELRFAESMKDLTTLLPSVSVADIGPPDISLPTAPQPYQAPDKFSLRLAEHTMDMDLSAAPRTVEKPSVEPLQLELEKLLENIGIGSDKVKTRNKTVKYKVRARPIMSNEEYAKFLSRRRGFIDPLKYYAKSIEKSTEIPELLRIHRELEDPFIRELMMAEIEIPVPILPLYLREQPLFPIVPGEIPLFEFPICEKDVRGQEEPQERRADEDVRRQEDPQERRAGEDVLRRDSERQPSLMPSTDLREVDAVRPESAIDEMQNLSLLMTALSLDYTPRISKPQQFEEAPFSSNQEDVRPTSLPERSVVNGGRRDPDSTSMRLDELLIKITDVCGRKDTTVISFIEICDVSKTKFEAAKVFVHLIELWHQKLVHLNQTSAHPSDIFIKLSR